MYVDAPRRVVSRTPVSVAASTACASSRQGRADHGGFVVRGDRAYVFAWASRPGGFDPERSSAPSSSRSRSSGNTPDRPRATGEVAFLRLLVEDVPVGDAVRLEDRDVAAVADHRPEGALHLLLELGLLLRDRDALLDDLQREA